MAVHEITERTDGTVDETHEFSAEEWAALSDWLAAGGPHAHRDVYEFTRGREAAAKEQEDRTVKALSVLYAVAQSDPRFRLEAR